MFSHWKLGRRLIAGFLIVAAITAAVALIGYLGMRSIDADADALHYDGLMPVLYLGRAGAAHAHLRGEVYRLLLFPDLRDEAEQAIRSEMLEVDEQMSLFKATHMDEVELAGLREFDRVWGSYQAEIENTIRQVRAGDEAGALAGLLSGSLPDDYTVVTTAIDDLIADTAADGEMIAHAGSQTFGYSSALAFGAGIAGTLLAIGLGYALSRSVTTPLSRTVQMIQEMGKGHLSARLRLNRRDEIGLMANALDEFADTLQNVVIGTMKQIAAGDLSTALTPRDDRDEIAPALMGTVRSLCGLIVEMSALTQGAVDGRLATRGEAGKFQGAYREIVQGVNDTIDALVGPIDQTRQVLAQVAKGDLNIVNLNGHYKGDYALLKSSIESMVNSLTAMALQSQHSAVSMTSATAEILASSTQMAASTREQASAVNQITATVQEIKASAEQVAQRARAVAETADQAIGTAEKGMMSIQDTIAGMDDIRAKVEAIAENILALSEQTQQIGDIIDTVTDIADQSNILALNAAIEAAQAGDAGRGFRVVADEVRSLAEQSRQAAAQVKVILSDIQKATNHAVMATEQGTKGVNAGSARVNSTEQTIRDITRAVQISAQAAQQIVAGVEQQTIGLDQIAIGMNDINHAAQQSAAGAHQSQQAARDLNLLAEQLKQVTAQYRL